MTMTWDDFLAGTCPQNEYELVLLSDRIWQIGSLPEIKAAIPADLFQVFISMNAIGNWEGDGWGCLIGDQPTLIPYLVEALHVTGFPSLAEALQKVLAVFPDFTVFEDSQSYCDVINFLQNVRFKVRDVRLRQFSAAQRADLNRQFLAGIDELERLTQPLWGGSRGWPVVLRYCADHMPETPATP